MARFRLFLVVLAVLATAGMARAQTCYQTLDELGVSYKRASKRHIDHAVEVRGELGGVVWEDYRGSRLLLDCELAAALARAGRFFAAHGIVYARYSSVFSRRRVRTSGRWSRHAFGKAIDVHSFKRSDGKELVIKDHYEQGLGDDVDCVGQPLTEEGAVLRTLSCQLSRSGFFDNVLDPDYDAHHYNHFHLDVSR